MSDEIQPGAGAPPEPAAPVEPPAAEPTAAEQADQAEWDAAEAEVFPGLTVNKEKKDEQTNSTTTASTTETTTEAPQGEPGSQVTDTTTVSDQTTTVSTTETTTEASTEAEPTATTARDTRLANKEAAEQFNAVREDVVKKMFSDRPTGLQDSSGGAIESVEDVMELIDPRSGEPFTREDAAEWFAAATKKFEANQKKTDAEIDAIVNVNLDLKDQADIINEEFGELLRADEGLRDKAWAKFQKTVKFDPDTGVPVELTIPLDEWYRDYLEPYAEAAAKAASTTESTTVSTTETTTAAPAETPEQKAQREQAEAAALQAKRADRSDIYSPGTGDTTDDDEKEWDQAHKTVFPQLNK